MTLQLELGPGLSSWVTGPPAAKIPNPEVQPIGRDAEMDLLCHQGCRSRKSIYLVVGYPWWLASPTCSQSWQSFSYSWNVPSTSISKHVALSFTGICLGFFFFPLVPSSLLEREWKQKWDMQGPATFGPGCRLLLRLSLLLAQGRVFLPSISPWGEGLKPLMLPPFHLGHMPRNLAWSLCDREPGPLKRNVAPLATWGWNQ